MSMSGGEIVVPEGADGRLVRVYRDGPGAVWKTAAARVELRIRSGEYPVGERLPSLRALAADLGVGHSTIQRAIDYLRSTGMVDPQHGVGVVVRSDEKHEPVTLSGTLADHETRLRDVEGEVSRLREEVQRMSRGEDR